MESENWILSNSAENDVCPICIGHYENPFNLACGHKFCLGCLEYLPEKSKENNKKKIECPMCRVESFIEGTETKKIVNSTALVRPRNIKLLEEFDASIGKDGKSFIPLSHTGMIGYGATDDSDVTLTNWTSIIIGPQDSPIGQVIYNLVVEVPQEYPNVPPKIRFQSPKIAMSCVNPQGWVDLPTIELVDITVANNEGMVEKGLGKYFVWDPSLNIADALIAIREMMYLRSVSTPSGNCASGNYF